MANNFKATQIRIRDGFEVELYDRSKIVDRGIDAIFIMQREPARILKGESRTAKSPTSMSSD